MKTKIKCSIVCCISSGSSLSAKVLVKGFPVYKGLILVDLCKVLHYTMYRIIIIEASEYIFNIMALIICSPNTLNDLFKISKIGTE